MPSVTSDPNKSGVPSHRDVLLEGEEERDGQQQQLEPRYYWCRVKTPCLFVFFFPPGRKGSITLILRSANGLNETNQEVNASNHKNVPDVETLSSKLLPNIDNTQFQSGGSRCIKGLHTESY